MAKETVETKVVQVRFDNSKFSKNINATIKQCEKFDKSLQFKGSKKEISAVQKAINGVEVKELNKELEKTDSIIGKISLSFKELLKIKILSKAMDTVINKSTAMMKSMLGLNNIVAGWQQYEAQMTNVGGILNQVESKGYGLEDVANAMERLRWYTDETSYSFTTLSNGIRQFVIAGIDLNKAAEAAMGVTNLAGSAKVFDEYKIQSAMDAVSKAMQTGYMDTLKWTSLTNTAGVVTEEFSQKLLDEAAAQGKLIKSAAGQYKTKKGGKLVTTENIRSTLSDRWLTADVLANVMDEYASASTAVENFSGLMEEQTDDSLTEINKMFKDSGKQFKDWNEVLEATYTDEEGNTRKVFEDIEDVTDMTARQVGKALERLGYGFDEVSLKAFYSAQETTSFSQAIGYVKKAISTQWANIFEQIFGDYKSATAFWSDVSDQFYSIFITPFERLTKIFTEWSSMAEGGAKDLRNTLHTIIDIIGRFKEAVASGFEAVFGKASATLLQKMTLALQRFFNNLKNNETLFKAITAITKIFASGLKIMGKVSSAVTKIWIKLFQALEPILEVLIDILDMVADGIVWIINTAEELGILDTIVNAISKALTYLAIGIRNVINWIKGRVDLEKITRNLAKAVDWLRQGIEWLIEKIKEAIEAIKDWWQESEFAQGVTKAFTKALEGVKSVFIGIKPAAEEASEGIDEVNESGEKASRKLTWIDRIKNAFISIGDFFKNAFISLKQFAESTGFLDTLKTFGDGLKKILLPIWETIAAFFKGIYETVKEDPIGALKKLLTAFGIVIAILLMLRVGQLMYSASWVLDEFARVIKAFRKNILAQRWKALMKSLLYVSASILIITYAIERISKISIGDALKGVAAIVYVLLAYIGVIKILTTKEGKQASIITGIKTIYSMLGLAIGLSIFINTFGKLLEKVKGYSTADLVKAGVIFYLIGALLIGVISVTFRKLNKEGIFKGEKLKGPGLLAFAKMLLFIWGFLKITLWFAEEVNKFDVGELEKAGIVIGVIVVTMSLIMLALSKITKTKTNVNVHKFSVEIGSILLIVLAAMAVLKVASGMSPAEVRTGALGILAVFFAIGLIAIAIGVATRIAQKENVELRSIKLNGAIASITVSALFAALAFKMISGLHMDVGTVWKVGGFLLVLYAVLGGIAIALSFFSKVVNRSIGKDGIKFTSTKSPVASAIFAITASALMAVLAFKLLNSLEPEEFKEGLSRFKEIMKFLVICVILMQLTAKEVNGAKGVIALMVALELMIISLVVIGALLNNEVITGDIIKRGALMFLGVALFILAFVLSLSKITKKFEFGLKQAGAIVLLMIVFAGLVAGFIFAAKTLNDYLNEEDEDISIIGSAVILAVLAAAIAGVLTGLVFAMAKAAKKLEGKIKSMYAIVGIISIITSLMVIIVGLIFVLKDIPASQIWKSFAVISAAGGLIIALLAMFVLVVKMKDALKIDNKKSWMLAITVGIMVAALSAIIGSLIWINSIGVKDAWKALAVCGAILGGLIVVLVLMMLAAKIAKGVNTSTLVMMAVLMTVFVAAIFAIVFAMRMISDMLKEENNNFETVAWTIGIIAAAIVVMILAFVGMAKLLNPEDMGNMIVIAVMIGLIGLIMLAIAKSFQTLDQITDLGRIVGTIAAIMAIMAGFILLMALIAKIDVVSVGFALGILAVIGAVIVAIAFAFKMLAGIDDLGRIVGTVAAILGIMLGIALIIGAITMTGVGAVAIWAGIAALAALALVFIAIAAAIAILSIGIEKVTNSITKLMNETTPEKCKNIELLGKSLMSLAAGTIVNALADFGASLLGLGGAFMDFQAATLEFKSSALHALGDIVEGIGSFFKGIGENKEAKAMERKVKAYKDFADAMDRIAAIDQNAIKQIINNVLDLFDTVSSTQNIGENNYLTQLIKYLEELKTSVEEIGNPVITPVLDLTSFREGMAEIRQSFGQSGGFITNYSAIADANNRKNIQSSNQYSGSTNPFMGPLNPSINLYNNFEMNDSLMYGQEASRNILSTIEYAIGTVASAPANLLKTLWNLW